MFKYIPRQIPSKIYVVGCGGTGSRLVPLLAQFIKTITHGVSPRGHLVAPVIYLCDDDVIEEKNLQRQNFIAPDVGKNKAVVLAQRYSRAFGVNIVAVPTRINTSTRIPDEALEQGGFDCSSNAMLIMCVDSAKARRDVLQFWMSCRRTSDVNSSMVIVDAGNEDDFGQVKFFNLAITAAEDTSSSIKKRLEALPGMAPAQYEVNVLPMDTSYYRDMVDQPGGSCADLDQTLAINALMATLIMGVVQNFYYMKPFTYNAIGISLAGGTNVTLNTPAFLAEVAANNKGRNNLAVTSSRDMACVHVTSILDMYTAAQVEALKAMGLDRAGQPIVKAAKKAQAAPAVVVEPVLDRAAVDQAIAEVYDLVSDDDLDDDPTWEAIDEMVETTSSVSETAATPATPRDLPPLVPLRRGSVGTVGF